MHDPQPAAILSFRGKGSARWIWRCHIDTSEPNPDVWAFLRPFLSEYDAAIFTMSEFAPPDMPTPRIGIIPPESTVHYRDAEYGFCSTRCRLEFLGAPERYVRRE